MLLKNDGMLPLDENKLKTVGVIGPNADSRRALMGNYHGTASRYITVQEGIQDALAGKARVLCSEGSHLYLDKTEGLAQEPDDRLAEALTVAENSDAVVLVVGLDETLEGEQGDTGNPFGSADKIDLLLPASQRRLMDAVLAVGKPTVIVLTDRQRHRPGRRGRERRRRADGLVSRRPGRQGRGRSAAGPRFPLRQAARHLLL